MSLLNCQWASNILCKCGAVAQIRAHAFRKIQPDSGLALNSVQIGSSIPERMLRRSFTPFRGSTFLLGHMSNRIRDLAHAHFTRGIWENGDEGNFLCSYKEPGTFGTNIRTWWRIKSFCLPKDVGRYTDLPLETRKRDNREAQIATPLTRETPSQHSHCDATLELITMGKQSGHSLFSPLWPTSTDQRFRFLNFPPDPSLGTYPLCREKSQLANYFPK